MYLKIHLNLGLLVLRDTILLFDGAPSQLCCCCTINCSYLPFLSEENELILLVVVGNNLIVSD